MVRNTLLLASTLILSVGCTEATPFPRVLDDPVDDASVDDGEVDAPEPRLEVEECELPGTEDLDVEEFVIQIRNPECSTAICLHYNLVTFCTHECEVDRDCRDLARGTCELEIFAGDPEMYGWYCVPPFATRVVQDQ